LAPRDLTRARFVRIEEDGRCDGSSGSAERRSVGHRDRDVFAPRSEVPLGTSGAPGNRLLRSSTVTVVARRTQALHWQGLVGAVSTNDARPNLERSDSLPVVPQGDVGTPGGEVGCGTCEADAAFLRSARPPYQALRPAIRVVDLFAGCGGLSLGASEAARALSLGIDVRLAVDFDETATEVYKSNFPGTDVRRLGAEELFDGALGEPLTPCEVSVRDAVGRVDALLGGPPCQGHSSLNNHTRRADPRNQLYLRMARAAEVLEPTIVLIENVPTVTRDLGQVVGTATARLRACGYDVAEGVVDLARLGAAQRRRRHVALASRDPRVKVAEILQQLGPRCAVHPSRSLRWAIEDLASSTKEGAFDTAPSPSADNATRIAWLFENDEDDLPNQLRPVCHQSDHSYKSMYGRLRWDEPAQTLTTGFGSMGQGRYVHPSKRRTITPHEAARLQFLPDFWDFSKASGRSRLAVLIGNAAPPVLASSLLEPALRELFGPNAKSLPRKERTRQGMSVRAPIDRAATPGPHPAASSTAASTRMQAVRRAGTEPELDLRAAVDRIGLGYETDAAVPGARARADLLFRETRVAVMVDGCYWHGCPQHATQPKSNAEWWRAKLAANHDRDAAIDRSLHDLGWVVLRFWEHVDADAAARDIAVVVAQRAAPQPQDADTSPA
jgi:DNA (cytosine-5)-methyltransferase 1